MAFAVDSALAPTIVNSSVAHPGISDGQRGRRAGRRRPQVAQEHPAHGALHGVGAGSVQRTFGGTSFAVYPSPSPTHSGFHEQKAGTTLNGALRTSN
jgi:hypothetical protein